MGLVLTEFANEILFEILGHLSGLDILSCRQVCQKLLKASRERSVWVNAVQRARCLLPPITISSTPTQDLERTLVRMEIMDAKWAGARAATGRVCAWAPFSEKRGEAFCLMPPYIVFKHTIRLSYDILTWCSVDDPTGEPVYQYYARPTVPCGIHFNQENRTLDIVTNDDDTSQLNVTSFQILGQDHTITQIRNCNLARPDICPDLDLLRTRVENDFLICFSASGSFSSVKVLIHFDTNKTLVCSLTTEEAQLNLTDAIFMPNESHRITPTHFIYANRLRVVAYKLPTRAQLNSNVQAPIQLHATDMCVEVLRGFHAIGPIFIQSPTRFVLPASKLGSHSQDAHTCLFWFRLDEHDSTCYLTGRLALNGFAAETGPFRQFQVMSCPLSSATTLGFISSLTENLETRTYSLRLLLDPPTEDDTIKGEETSRIRLKELELPLPVSQPTPEVGRIRSRVLWFDAYSGSMITKVQLFRREEMPDAITPPPFEFGRGNAIIRFTE